jgi:hypothetical protein
MRRLCAAHASRSPSYAGEIAGLASRANIFALETQNRSMTDVYVLLAAAACFGLGLLLERLAERLLRARKRL